MNKINKTLIAVSVAMLSSNAMADVRTTSMGGTGVASAHYLSAPFVNPARLTSFEGSDDVGVMLPSIEVRANDEDNLVDKVDALDKSYSDMEQAINNLKMSPNSQNLENARAISNQLSKDFIAFDNVKSSINGSLGASIAIPNKYLTFALFTQSRLEIASKFNITKEDKEKLANMSDIELATFSMDSLSSDVTVTGAAISDFGISLAKSFPLKSDYKVSVGISPKMQRVDLFDYTAKFDDFDKDAFKNKENHIDDMNFNIDMGVTVDIPNNFSVGFVANNLIEKDYTRIDGTSIYTISPSATIGLAYNSYFVNAALDVDVVASDFNPSKMARLGAEVNAWNWAQLRVGYSHDMEDVSPDLFTVGIGLSPFNVVHVDLVGMISEEVNNRPSELGAGIQFSTTF